MDNKESVRERRREGEVGKGERKGEREREREIFLVLGLPWLVKSLI